jgi:hypothetical protein
MLIKRDVLLQILIAAILFILSLIDKSIIVSEIILLLVFIECFIISTKAKFFNIYQIFLFMMLFFNLTIPFLNIFGLFQYPSGNLVLLDAGINKTLSDQSMVKTFDVLGLFLVGTSIGWILWKDDYRITQVMEYRISEVSESSDHLFKKIIKYIFFVLWPIELVYQIFQAYLAIKFGYVETIHLRSVTSSALSYLEYADYIYMFIGLGNLYFAEDSNQFKKYALMFAVPYAVLLLTGQRGTGISIIVTLLFVYSFMYKKINFRRILIYGVCILLIIIAIGNYRWTRETTNLLGEKGGLIDSVVNEFVLNSESVMVIPYTIELMGSFTNGVPFLFGYVTAIFTFTSNYTVEGILAKSYLAQHITYLLNPSKLLRGSTIGTNIVAEFYEFAKGNYLIIFILGIILFWFAGWFMKRINKNIMCFYFGFSYLQQLIMSPRGSVMKIFNKLSLVYILIYFVVNIIINARSKK